MGISVPWLPSATASAALGNRELAPAWTASSGWGRPDRPYLKSPLRAVSPIHQLPCYYANPDLSQETRFRVGTVDNCQGLELVYSDGTRTARLEVELDTTDLDHTKAAVADLNQRFARDEKSLRRFETGGVPFAGFSEVVSQQ